MNAWSLEYSFRVDADNGIIYAKIHGLWKAETARGYHEDFKVEVAPLLGRPWAKLVDLSNWRTSYPEVSAVIGRHMAWSRQNGCVLSAYVLNNPSTFRQLNQMFSKGGIKEVALTFRTMAEAEKHIQENWIARRGTGPAQARDIC